ncbi:phosphate ABC transporter substrate-binding protein [Spongiibacter taiwanensis]|uniref:phosphate ABC transporter substrate-binding protein n=1 Tax=Spongiibacter taiwanensis TaxID=1748242 RepID=UPI002034E209|nr:phosphate ABC transporter substrate-binding protein [Spongiibacter taiwanensis]USA42848.1 phosphate ABC transporter substrate-binding protein [Spongiibacter taiwanensis]
MKLISCLAASVMLSQMVHSASAEVVVVVAADSPVNSLSKSHIANIFLGRNNYLDGRIRVTPVDQPEGSQARQEFYENVVNWNPASVKAHWSKMIFTGRGKPPRQVASDTAVKALVASSPGAIGYIDAASVDSSVKVLKLAQ